MKFVISPSVLKTALEFTSVGDGKSSAVTTNVLLKSNGDRAIVVVGTDMETTTEVEVTASVDVEGSICVPYKKLLSLTKTLSSDMTLTEESNHWVQLKSGSSKFRIKGVNSEQFPVTPTPAKFEITINSKIFAKMVKSVEFAVTGEETRFALLGIKLEIADGKIHMVATDGSRVSYVEGDVDGDLDTLLPKKCLAKVSKFPDADVNISEDENHLFFKSDNKLLCARKMIGTFPAYGQVINAKVPEELMVNYDKFSDAVALALLMADDKTNAIKLSLSHNSITVSSTSAEEGEGETVVDCNYPGDDIIIPVNALFLKDFLTVKNREEVYINFLDNKSPVCFNYGEDTYKYVVMPLRM